MSTLFFPFQFINMLGSFYMCTNAGKEWGNFRVYKKEAKVEIQFSNLYLTFFILLSEIQNSKLRLNFIFGFFLHLRYLNKLAMPSAFPIEILEVFCCHTFLYVNSFTFHLSLQTNSFANSSYILAEFLL